METDVVYEDDVAMVCAQLIEHVVVAFEAGQAEVFLDAVKFAEQKSRKTRFDRRCDGRFMELLRSRRIWAVCSHLEDASATTKHD